ncbi:homeobox protein DBX2-like [Actinia tenebrosa]|uniref:Homeobox protein DBX2-like n=1 Tax=Actinia tenebrosa TaxID=6105 RepID=A0A6P8JFZ8_ACTTE|nr:homeobox protein DBX2-like [Actinia tenebrosa]
MSQSNFLKSKDRHFEKLESSKTYAEKTNSGNEDEGLTKPEESIPQGTVLNLPVQRTYTFHAKITQVDVRDTSLAVKISESDSEVFRMRSRRTYFTTQQREVLEQAFSTSQYINPKLREVLASSIGVTDRVVQTWFKNRRVKWRKERRTQLKVFVEPSQPKQQPLVLMPHIAYAPMNYYSQLRPYYEQRQPTTTSASNMTATSGYLQNGFFAWDKDAFN